MATADDLMVCFAARAANSTSIVAFAVTYLGEILQVLSLVAIAKVSSIIFFSLSFTESSI